MMYPNEDDWWRLVPMLAVAVTLGCLLFCVAGWVAGAYFH